MACPLNDQMFEARADAMVASPSFSKVPPMKHATLIAFPSAVKVTVSTGGLAGLSSFAGTPSKNDLRKRVVLCCVFIFDEAVSNYPRPTPKVYKNTFRDISEKVLHENEAPRRTQVEISRF